jgi:hypothetical protein
MTDPNDSTVERIRKLLAMAERGITEEERDAFNAKATSLMVQHAIDEAMITDIGRAISEKIISRTYRINCPKSYSYEYVTIGCQVAKALGSNGLLQKTHDNRTDLTLVGYETDIEMVWQLTESLVRQCTLALGPWFRDKVRDWHSGTEKFQMKRGFISGFGVGAGDKLKEIKRVTLHNAGTGSEVAVRDREMTVSNWMAENMRTGSARGRSYEGSSRAGGWGAGQRADVGGARVGGVRKQIGG